jgi:hypothetical protein
MRKLKRQNANFEFSLHQNLDKGPNRITFDPDVALKFFKKLKAKEDEAGAKVKHICTGLVWETDEPEDLAYFINRVVASIGVINYGWGRN